MFNFAKFNSVSGSFHALGDMVAYTTPADGFERLVGLCRGREWLWIHKNYRS